MEEDLTEVPKKCIRVYVEEVEEGVRVGYDLEGGFSPLEAPTVLELAARIARATAGLQ